MLANRAAQELTWLVYLVIFLSVTRDAVRQPRRSTINIALFFAVPFVVILISSVRQLGWLPASPITGAISGSLLLGISYVLLRLVADFTVVPPRLLTLAGLVLVGLDAGLFVFLGRPQLWLTALQVGYFLGLQCYAGWAFWQASQRSSGVTARRMTAAALGSVWLGVAVLFIALTRLGAVWATLSQLCSLASAASYYIAFAPPRLLRRAWQEPELRAFLGRAAQLPRLPSARQIADEIAAGAARAVGAQKASVGLLNPATGQLHFVVDGEELVLAVDSTYPAGAAYSEQRALFVDDLPQRYPSSAARSRHYGATALLAAPITAGTTRLGVLAVYATRAPLFAADDLALVALLADQAAVVLESRTLIETASRLAAREETSRLKEDFLSSAAHDLKTPLTTMIAQAQLLERRILRDPTAPADLTAVQRMIREAERLRTLVLELLDAAQAEQGQLVGRREAVDLSQLAAETCERHCTARHRCILEAASPVVGQFDRTRIAQLLENLVENAVKYTPAGGDIRVKVWNDDTTAHFSVADTGIGIPPTDLPTLFDRFFRASNVDARRFAGMGLGLFICRGIVEQHGGQIWATSALGSGTTFWVELPLQVSEPAGRLPADPRY